MAAYLTKNEIEEDLQSAGLELIKKIGEGSFNRVYLVQKNQRHYACKIVKSDIFSKENNESTVTRLRKECAVLARLPNPSIVKVYEVGIAGRSPYFLMEYIGENSLEEHLFQNKMTETEVVELGKQLASALVSLENSGLVHRDLNPRNIILTNNMEGKLIDFEFAAALENFDSTDLELETIVGSLKYASPEQCRVIDLFVDSRSDLYSLGCVLYECAFGEPLVKSNDPTVILQQLATRSVKYSGAGDKISLGLRQIIFKLIQKDPEDRFQSARSLLRSFEDLDSLNRRLEAGEAVKLEERNSIEDNRSQTPLFGRKLELGILLEGMFKYQVRTHGKKVENKSSFQIIKGLPGIGKSRLTKELLVHLVENSYLCLSTKCALDRQDPFSAIVELLNNLTWDLEDLSDQLKELLRSHLQQSRKVCGDSLVGLSPDFKINLGLNLKPITEQYAQPEVFASLLVKIFSALSQELKLALIFDDIQWLDSASKKVLLKLVCLKDDGDRVVISTARNDIDSKMALSEIVAEAGTNLTSVLELKPLSTEESEEFASYLLGAKKLNENITGYLNEKTQGSPFEMREFITALTTEGILTYSWGGWYLDDAKSRALQLPNDLIDLILWRLREIKRDTLFVLQTASLVGKSFSSEILQKVFDGRGHNIREAIQVGLNFQLISEISPGFFRFTHDKVIESLTSEIEPNLKNDAHRWIAESLGSVSHYTSFPIYEYAFHLGRTNLKFDPSKCFQANLDAGRKAQLEGHPQLALEFYEKSYSIHIEYPQKITAAFLTYYGQNLLDNSISKKAEEMALAAIDTSITKNELVRAYLLLASIHLLSLRSQDLWVVLQLALKEVGHAFPKNRFLMILTMFLYWGRGFILSKTKFLSRKPISARKMDLLQLEAQLFEVANLAAYYNLSPLNSVSLAFRSRYCAERIGSPTALFGYHNNIALLYCIVGAGKKAAKSLNYCKKIGNFASNPKLEAKFSLTEAYAEEFQGHSLAFERKMKECIAHHQSWLRTIDLMGGTYLLIWSLMVRGKISQAIDLSDWVNEHERTSSSNGDSSELERGIIISGSVSSILLILNGDIIEGTKVFKGVEKIADRMSHEACYSHSIYLSCQILRFLFTDELDQCQKNISDFESNIGLSPMEAASPISNIFIFKGYAQLRILQEVKSKDKSSFTNLEKTIRDLGFFSKLPLFRAHTMVLKAWVFHLKGRNKKALILANSSILAAEKVDAPWVTVEANHLKATIYLERGERRLANSLAAMACRSAAEDGLNSLASFIGEKFAIRGFTQNASSHLGVSTMAHPNTVTISQVAFDEKRTLSTMLSISKASTDDHTFETHCALILDEAILALKSDRGLLFLQKENETFELEFHRQNGGFEGKSNRERRFDLIKHSQSLVNHVISTGRSAIQTGMSGGEIISVSESMTASGIKAVIATPLFRGTRVTGVLYFDSSLAKGIFREQDLGTIEAIGALLSLVLGFYRQKNEILDAGRKKTDLLREMSAGISHELNNPLAIVVGNAEIGRAQTKDKTLIKRFDLILNTSARMKDILIQVRKLTVEKVQAPNEISELRDIIKTSIEKTKLVPCPNIKVESGDSKFVVKGSREDFVMAIACVLDNSKYYIEKDGGGEVLIDIKSDSEFAFVRISNTGESIDADLLEKIFTPFITGKPIGDGVGLGLTLARNYLEINCGAIDFIGTAEKVEFLLKFPLATYDDD